jgi:hypothetical protein
MILQRRRCQQRTRLDQTPEPAQRTARRSASRRARCNEAAEPDSQPLQQCCHRLFGVQPHAIIFADFFIRRFECLPLVQIDLPAPIGNRFQILRAYRQSSLRLLFTAHTEKKDTPRPCYRCHCPDPVPVRTFAIRTIQHHQTFAQRKIPARLVKHDLIGSCGKRWAVYPPPHRIRPFLFGLQPGQLLANPVGIVIGGMVPTRPSSSQC